MDNQTESMIIDAKLYQLPITKYWCIVYEYESSRYFLTLDNKFTETTYFLKSSSRMQMRTYLDILQGNIDA